MALGMAEGLGLTYELRVQPQLRMKAKLPESSDSFPFRFNLNRKERVPSRKLQKKKSLNPLCLSTLSCNRGKAWIMFPRVGFWEA